MISVPKNSWDVVYFTSISNYNDFQLINKPDGCVFLSKCEFNNSNACGVNEVRLFLFLEGSTPMKSLS